MSLRIPFGLICAVLLSSCTQAASSVTPKPSSPIGLEITAEKLGNDVWSLFVSVSSAVKLDSFRLEIDQIENVILTDGAAHVQGQLAEGQVYEHPIAVELTGNPAQVRIVVNGETAGHGVLRAISFWRTPDVSQNGVSGISRQGSIVDRNGEQVLEIELK